MTFTLTQLGKVATVIMGQSPSGGAVSTDPEQGLPLLNGPTEFGPVSPQPRQWTSEWTREAEPGDTLFCVRGSTTGRMNIAQMQYAIGRGIAAVRGVNRTDTQFLRYALADGLSKLLSLTSGSVFPNISAGDLKAFEVPWPDAPIRVAIVDVLASIDARIESDRKVVAAAEAFLDALSAAAVAELPRTKLSDLVQVSRTVIDPATLGEELIDHFSLPAFDSGARPQRVEASSIMSGKLVIVRRSILLSRLNPKTNRTWWVTPDPSVRSVASTEFSCLTADSDVDLAAVWLATRDESFRTELSLRVTGTSGSHQRVRPDDLLSMGVPDVRMLPTEPKTAALAALVTAEDKRCEMERLTAFRDALLPELLSGRIRVSDAEVR